MFSQHRGPKSSILALTLPRPLSSPHSPPGLLLLLLPYVSFSSPEAERAGPNQSHKAKTTLPLTSLCSLPCTTTPASGSDRGWEAGILPHLSVTLLCVTGSLCLLGLSFPSSRAPTSRGPVRSP